PHPLRHRLGLRQGGLPGGAGAGADAECPAGQGRHRLDGSARRPPVVLGAEPRVGVSRSAFGVPGHRHGRRPRRDHRDRAAGAARYARRRGAHARHRDRRTPAPRDEADRGRSAAMTGLRGEAAILGFVELPAQRKQTRPPMLAIEQWASLAAATVADAGVPASVVTGLVAGSVAESEMFVPATLAEYLGLPLDYGERVDLGGATSAGMIWRAA